MTRSTTTSGDASRQRGWRVWRRWYAAVLAPSAVVVMAGLVVDAVVLLAVVTRLLVRR